MTRTNNDSKISILVDSKHKTYYCIDPNGKSYIKKDIPKEERKRR